MALVTISLKYLVNMTQLSHDKFQKAFSDQPDTRCPSSALPEYPLQTYAAEHTLMTEIVRALVSLALTKHQAPDELRP